MSAPLYDVVHSLALEITNASETENDQLAVEAYGLLKELCENQEGTDLDHPLQWEALGDFSENHLEALQAYQKGLACSEKIDLPEYSASIKFAMAESYFEKNNLVEAQRLAAEASVDVANTSDNELSAAISEFLNAICST